MNQVNKTQENESTFTILRFISLNILFENQASLSESTTSDDFIVKDLSGNIVLIVNETGSMFLKGSLNENGVPIPTSESITSSTRKYNYTYDANGNVIQDEKNYYEYNDFNQLIRVRGNNSNGARQLKGGIKC